MKFIEKYIVHYQDLHSGDYLLLWLQLSDFLRASEEFRTAKASLLYQKFIKKDAYRYIAFISDEQREQIEMLLEAGMQENAEPVPQDIFDEVMDETETLLIQRVFKGFYGSVFYREYKEAVVLSSNL
jgi:DNA-binding transcriptional regulator of glucitol operon